MCAVQHAIGLDSITRDCNHIKANYGIKPGLISSGDFKQERQNGERPSKDRYVWMSFHNQSSKISVNEHVKVVGRNVGDLRCVN